MAAIARTAAHPEPATASPRIWTIGGGQGGVGKSLVTSGLAAAMSGMGHRCAVVDCDLGAANLHTLLGASRPRLTLSHFLTGEVASLAEVMVQTSVPNLWLVSGNQALLEMANPKHREKELLLSQIGTLDVDDIFLDLGAGSAYQVLDFFLLARRGLVVVTPEPTAIENAEHFLRAALYRSLRFIAQRPDVRAVLSHLRDEHHKQRVRSAGELIALVKEVDPAAAKPLEETAQAFTPFLIVNQLASVEHGRVGPDLVASCRDRLGISIELAGTIGNDLNVRAAVAQHQPMLQAFPHSRFSKQIEAIVSRLLLDCHDRQRKRAYERYYESPVPPPRAAARPELPVIDLAQPGASLRRCREQLGLSLNEITERTRIRGLEWIENEKFDRLPAELYLKSYLLTYARELGIREADDLTASYLAKYRNRKR